jgi:hypothetical protein
MSELVQDDRRAENEDESQQALDAAKIYIAFNPGYDGDRQDADGNHRRKGKS